MKYVEFLTDKFGLHIQLLPAGRVFLEETVEKRPALLGTDALFRELIEWHMGEGWTDMRPEDIGALTSSIILSPDADFDDHGKLLSVQHVYWFPQYQLISPAACLQATGMVTFACDDPPAGSS